MAAATSVQKLFLINFLKEIKRTLEKNSLTFRNLAPYPFSPFSSLFDFRCRFQLGAQQVGAVVVAHRLFSLPFYTWKCYIPGLFLEHRFKLGAKTLGAVVVPQGRARGAAGSFERGHAEDTWV